VTRTRLLLAALVAAGLTSCHQSSAPPAVAVVASPAAVEPDSEPMKSNQSVKQIAVAEPAPVADGGTFAFPDDTGGKALAKTLPPTAPPAMPSATPVTPRERKLPAFLEAPTPPLPDAANSPPRLALAPTREPRPVPLPDRVPLDLGGVIPDLPARPEIHAGALTRTEGRDVSQPAELPPLSPKPVADRAPLADPTVEFTAASVISPTLPLRTEPTGFVRINLPDPFENADSAKVRTPVVEDPNRVLPR
jgi:hypothetical protein